MTVNRYAAGTLAPWANGAPAVSIIMPTFRRSTEIGRSIAAILAQTGSDFELLVRDDGDGRDGTEQSVRDIAAGDPRVAYHRNPTRRGMPGNINDGILASKGRYIAICHDHDLYEADFLERMVGLLRRHPTALFAHCAIRVVDADGAPSDTHIGDWEPLTTGPVWLHRMLESFHCPVCALTVVRREAHSQYGLYDPVYGFVADVEMWMRLASVGDVAYVAKPLIVVRDRAGSGSVAPPAAAQTKTIASMQRRYVPLAYSVEQRLTRRIGLELRLLRALGREQAAGMTRGLRSRLISRTSL